MAAPDPTTQLRLIDGPPPVFVPLSPLTIHYGRAGIAACRAIIATARRAAAEKRALR